MSTNPDRITLTSGSLRALLHIADYARSVVTIARIAGEPVDLATARMLAAMHEDESAAVMRAHLDELERAPWPPVQASQEGPATTQAPEEARTVECPRCDWHGPSSAAPAGLCPECTDAVRTGGTVPL